MTKSIFRSSFLIGIIALVLVAVLLFTVQYRQTLDETYLALQQEAIYAKHGLQIGGQDYLESLGEINRITWTSSNGDVLYDSQYSLPIANQMQCQEITLALQAGEGQGIRRSESSGRQIMYYALVCDDGTILRLSCPLDALQQALQTISPILWVLLLVLLISALLSFRTARRIVKPINELNLDDLSSSPYPELSPLLGRIQEQKKTILQQRNEQERLRREFSANVSHELKTPLTSISGFAELMSTDGFPQEKVKEFSQDIYRESQRMITLVDDIIHLSRLDEGGIQLKLEPVDLYALASDTVDSLRTVAERHHITMELHGKTTEIIGVRQLLNEAVYNLCDNAIKYNKTGGNVRVDISETDESCILRVADTGIGIPKEHQKRVFERFYRVDKSHSKEIGGTGLGLSIVKHVALYHQAKVKLESTPDKGTTISMIFPKP